MPGPVLKLVRGATELAFGVGEPLAAIPRWVMEEWESPVVVTNRYSKQRVTEQIRARAEGTSFDNLTNSLEQPLHDMADWARQYATDRTEDVPVFLVKQGSGETGDTQALVTAIAQQPSGYLNVASVQKLRTVNIGFTRMPFWERRTAVNMDTGTLLGTASNVYDYTAGAGADVVGDIPARVSRLNIYPAAGKRLGRVWVGVRTAAKHGTLANFVPVWECEDTDFTLGTDASRTASGTASGGNQVEVSFATPGWAKRLSMFLSGVTANYTDNFGLFLSLFRARVDDTTPATTAEVYIAMGYRLDADATFTRNGSFTVASKVPTWEVYRAGNYRVPLHNNRGLALATTKQGKFTIQIWARRLTGTGKLYLDCMMPVPIDEGFLYSENFDATTDQFWSFSEDPLGECASVVHDTGAANTIDYSVGIDPPYFRLPPGDGRLVIVRARQVGAELTDTATASGNFVPCWSGGRGNE